MSIIYLLSYFLKAMSTFLTDIRGLKHQKILGWEREDDSAHTDE